MTEILRTTLRVAAGGRIVIPADVRERLRMHTGTELVLTVEDDHATLMNAKAARQKARDAVRRYVDPKSSLSRELLTQRKEEAHHE